MLAQRSKGSLLTLCLRKRVVRAGGNWLTAVPNANVVVRRAEKESPALLKMRPVQTNDDFSPPFVT